MPKVSVIVPVYNVEKYVQPCIESIYRQGLNENQFEVIIVNDGTKDKSNLGANAILAVSIAAARAARRTARRL